MTLSETQIDKFCQSPFISRHLPTASQLPQLPYWERWPFLFLRQPPLAVSMSWEYQARFPGLGKILRLSLEIGLVRQPSVFAAIVITALYFPTRYRCAAFCASARFGDKRAMRSYIALASSRRPA